MNVEISGNPDYGHVRFGLDPGETVFAEGGAMAWMSSHLAVTSRLLGGILAALGRRVVGGESLFVGEYTAPADVGAELVISPAIPGQVLHRKMDGRPLLFEPRAYLASTPGVTLRTRFGGLRGLLSGEGLFFLECGGEGDLWFNAYGAVVEKSLSGDELIVDTGHVVGWEKHVDWKVTGIGNLVSTLFSGEGLVIRFSGRGKVLVQTRSLGGVLGWLRGFLRG